jgi:phosphoribosylaminoimidazolecarboxamide formyltransferase/IMP cyclohydrolase
MKIALISVFDKTNIENLANFLLNNDYYIFSSGGTFKKLKTFNFNNNHKIFEISDKINFPEILNGRVKTLHPKIFGAILARSDNQNDMNELIKYEIEKIDIVIVNLYPFSNAVLNNYNENDIIENIDIGGHTLIRAAAKNFNDVLVLCDPNDYNNIINEWDNIDISYRKKYSSKAFKYIMDYDISIYKYFHPNSIINNYQLVHKLKYGLNPQQKNAGIYKNINNNFKFPFQILNGNPGYINILDAIFSWNLVYDLKNILKLPAAASFKHTSPAGAAVYVPLSDQMKDIYYINNNKNLTKLSIAFIRARNADPMSSYGDFIALSDKVDDETAKLISNEISDGIIAPDYSYNALEILKKKKNGNYVILLASQNSSFDFNELRELYNIT